MHFSIYNKFGALNSVPVLEAVALGLRRHGHEISYHNNNADVAVIWSQLWAGRMQSNKAVWDLYKSTNRIVLVVEVGAIKRNHTWKLGINGKYLLPKGNSRQRADSLGLKLREWQTNGQEIIIACQRGDSNQWPGHVSVDQWVADTVNTLSKYTARQIIVRQHPRYKVNLPNISIPVKLPGTYDSFDFGRALSNAWAVVNWNSNPGVESIIAGIPAFVGESSLAAPVANLNLADIEKPLRPDRQQWLNDLAYTEWTVNEIAQGIPFDLLLPKPN